MLPALPLFAPTWASNPILNNGMIIMTVLLIIAATGLLLYFASKRIKK